MMTFVPVVPAVAALSAGPFARHPRCQLLTGLPIWFHDIVIGAGTTGSIHTGPPVVPVIRDNDQEEYPACTPVYDRAPRRRRSGCGPLRVRARLPDLV